MLLEDISDATMIIERDEQPWARKLYFAYQKAKEMSKPSPIVFYLGLWRMTDKQGNKKKFLCGINLAALSSKQELVALQEHLPEILKHKDTKSRYEVGSALLPNIFRKGYRTYNTKNISGRPLFGRLYALKVTDQDEEMAQQLATKDYEDGLTSKEWEKLSDREQTDYREKAIHKRGEEDIDRKEQAKKDRDDIEDYYAELEAQKEKEELEADEELETELEPEEPEEPEPEEPEPEPEIKKLKLEPLDPGPEISMTPEPEVPMAPEPAIAPEPEVPIDPGVSPIQNIQTGLPTPRNVKPEPDEKPDEESEEKPKPIANYGFY